LAKASCNCGAGYVPAGQRAAAAIKANPDKSDRAIADEIGVSNQTVRRARKKSTVTGVTVATRTGRDGKKRKLPKRPAPAISDPVAEVNAFHKEVVTFATQFSDRFTAWHRASPLLDSDGKAALMQAFYLCSDAFARLAQQLDGR